jgi:hypothetical protein
MSEDKRPHPALTLLFIVAFVAVVWLITSAHPEWSDPSWWGLEVPPRAAERRALRLPAVEREQRAPAYTHLRARA